MIPLVATTAEFTIMKKLVDDTAAAVFAEKKGKVEYMVGTMIELPRAALTADEIAASAEFFSFGTNDLTQTTLGLSRDDAASFLGDYVSKGIRVNCICPGTVHTPFVDSYLQKFHAGEIEETMKKLDARQPMGRMGKPGEIAKMAVYLASDEAEFVTGAILTIDGGLTAR